MEKIDYLDVMNHSLIYSKNDNIVKHKNYWLSYNLFYKRIFDLIIVSPVLIFSIPVSIIIAFLIKIGSDGPIIFKQERIGRNGKPFIMYKFRSMYENSEPFGPGLSYIGDPRITKVGQILRKYKIDELPQLINVLIGDMSIVGPRPERLYYIDLISKKLSSFRNVLDIKPGLTSWGQIYYGYAENVNQMIDRFKYDKLYLDKNSFLTDLKIIFKTIPVILIGKSKKELKIQKSVVIDKIQAFF